MADFVSMVTISDHPHTIMVEKHKICMYLYILCRRGLIWQSVYLKGIMQETVRQI